MASNHPSPTKQSSSTANASSSTTPEDTTHVAASTPSASSGAALPSSTSQPDENLHLLPPPTKATSLWWQYYQPYDLEHHKDKEWLARCKFCGYDINYSNGRGSLRTHIAAKHRETYSQHREQYNLEKDGKRHSVADGSTSSKRLIVPQQPEGSASPKNKKSKRDKLLAATAAWVSAENRPSNIVEKQSFQRMMRTVNRNFPTFTEEDIQQEMMRVESVEKKKQRMVVTTSHRESTTSSNILVRETAAQTAPKLDISSSSLFDAMIHPLDPKIFRQHIFRQKALYIQSSNRNYRIADIVEKMYGLDSTRLLRETSSDHVFVWLKQDGGKVTSLEMEDTEQAILLHTVGGHATYCRAPPEVEQPMVYHMLQGTGMGCGQYDPSGNATNILGRGEVEVFIGTHCHTTDFHTDFQENFTIQLSGTKRWTLSHNEPTKHVRYPLRACTPHYKSPETVESQLKAAHLSNPNFQFNRPTITAAMDTVVLEPGDILYFPAGMWHKVETLTPGVSINVSLMASNYATVTCQALQHLLLQHDDWRETIVNDPNKSDAVVQRLQMLLLQLPLTIQQFCSDFSGTGAAQALLPPMVRHPPRLKLDSTEEEEYSGDVEEEQLEEVEGSEEADVISEEAGIFQEEKNHETAGDGSRENNSDVVDVESKIKGMFQATIVDTDTFEAPVEWSLPSHGDNVIVLLKRNSLAHLVPLQDLTNFYHPRFSASVRGYWMLNINYGGNEMHESMIRVILKDDGDPRLLDGTTLEATGDDFPSRIKCFLFYGLYVAVQQQRGRGSV